MKKDCTMIVCSCDSYSDTWEPLFKSIKKYWENFDMPIVLNTETKTYQMEGLKIKCLQLFKNKKVNWGERFIEHLKRIDTEFVFLMLDDYFLVEPVDTTVINNCLNWMRENSNIAVFSFHRVDDPNNTPSEKYTNFDRRPQNGMYRLNCQAAIWRRERLLKFLKKNESPWDFEIYGSIRSSKYKDEFYSIREGVKEPLNYNMVSHGTGICRGKWVKSIVEPLFKELDVKVDFSKRGFTDENDDTILTNRNFKDKIIGKIKYLKARIESKI